MQTESIHKAADIKKPAGFDAAGWFEKSSVANLQGVRMQS
jgi:hypothetical protein